MTTAEETFKSELAELLSARYPLVHIPTHEEDRALRAISEVCEDRAKTMLVWSTSQGVFTLDHHKRTVERGDLAAALADLETVAESLVPIARLRREEIEQMRRWADSHALKASTVPDSSAEKTGRDLDIADAAAG